MIEVGKDRVDGPTPFLPIRVVPPHKLDTVLTI